MYKTLVYTLVNGNIYGLAHRKQQKITKGDIARITLTVCHWLLNNITFCNFCCFRCASP